MSLFNKKIKMDENLVLTLEIYNKIQTAAPFRASKLLKKDERPRLVPVSISILEKKIFDSKICR